MKPDFELVVGLETHVQLKTQTKLFCGCPTTFGAPPNTQTCPVCLGLPGSLPVLNRSAFELGMRAALALGAAIQPVTHFDRKSYFYPDLPKGYQISQFARPFSLGGAVALDGGRAIRLVRVHLEEDAGKLVHAGQSSAVDLNRAGMPLIEIVSEPDLRSAAEAVAYLTEVRSILRFTGVSDADMEKGELRCDVNVSLRPRGTEALGVKAEVKNLNSFKFVGRAVEAEVRRQGQILSGGGTVKQETLLYDPEGDLTFPMRGKEEAHDYRYFPDPDLRPLHVGEEWIARARAALPELPRAKRERYVRELGLSAYDAGVLTGDPAVAAYFEAVSFADPKVVANWVTNELPRVAPAGQVPPARLDELLTLVAGGTITAPSGKIVLQAMAESGRPASAIVAEKGLAASRDSGEMERVVGEVVAANPKAVADYRGGKEASLKFLLGQVMRAMKGRADPKAAEAELKKRL